MDDYKPGDDADFERLYRTSYGKMLAIITTMLGDRRTAEECVQDAFAKAYKNWPKWKPNAPAEAWLYRIAVNFAISRKRRQKLEDRYDIEATRRLREPQNGHRSLVEDLAEALSEIPPKQAAAIVLRFYYGYTNRAIAYILGVPERTVASRIFIAKAKLRKLLLP